MKTKASAFSRPHAVHTLPGGKQSAPCSDPWAGETRTQPYVNLVLNDGDDVVIVPPAARVASHMRAIQPKVRAIASYSPKKVDYAHGSGSVGSAGRKAEGACSAA